ncbi:hypothetical protein [Myceligenerans crystallogenes]|uniref:NUDIX domain-containing protein n=1 Tax=Myceligenerans crystallogenes TaxID=316335 RepID=A0ABN2NI34_9MICO
MRFPVTETRTTEVGSRLCVGGALALTAIARPKSSRGGNDYLLLVQERSDKVLNARRQLAVIPKGFHGPLNDVAGDATIGATIMRELEEELFGRKDVDSTIGESRHADPMHPDHLSAPMAWLTRHDGGQTWRTECTGIGFNMVNGNYEFAGLIVIEDETWWEQFGGQIEANWESHALRRYSSKDALVVDTLAHDPSWSGEGLFALLQGIRRLHRTGDDRIDLPMIELEPR